MESRGRTPSDLFWLAVAAALLIITLISIFSSPSAFDRAEAAFGQTLENASEDPLDGLLLSAMKTGSFSYTDENGTLFSLVLADGAGSAQPGGVVFDGETLTFAARDSVYALPAGSAAVSLAGIPLGETGPSFAAAGLAEARSAGLYREFYELLKKGFAASGTEEREMSVDGERVAVEVPVFTAEEKAMTEAFDRFLARAKEPDGAGALLSLEGALQALCGEDVSFRADLLEALEKGGPVKSASGSAKVMIRKGAAVGLELVFSLEREARWDLTFIFTAQDRAAQKISATLTLKRTLGSEEKTLTARLTDRVTESDEAVYARQINLEVSDPGNLFLRSRTDLSRKIQISLAHGTGDFLVRATLDGEEYTVKGAATLAKDALTAEIRSAVRKVTPVISGPRRLTLALTGEAPTPPAATADFAALSGLAKQRLFVEPEPVPPETGEEPHETQSDPAGL